MRPVERTACHRLVIVKQRRFGQAHRTSEAPKNLAVWQGIANWRNGWMIDYQRGMAIALVQIKMLHLRGSGQHPIGPVCGIRLKMLKHHREQIFAGKSPNDRFGIGRYRYRVGVPDDDGFNGNRGRTS